MPTTKIACPLCGRTIATLPALKKHVRRTHTPTCLACGREFNSWSGVVMHIAHGGVKDGDAHALTYWLASNSRGGESERLRALFHRGQDVALETLLSCPVEVEA